MKRRVTTHLKEKDVKRSWHLIDAKSNTFGRIASLVATHLIGKNKVEYSAHVDIGDFVVVTNVKHIVVTGNKLKDKIYYRHSWYPGAIKSRTLQESLDRDPKKVLENAVRLMLPKNSLQVNRLKRLKMFEEEKHTYQKEIKDNK